MGGSLEEEWRNFELYEKVRIREHRKRFILIFLAILVFFGLCSKPVIEERLPKWRSLRAAQVLSVEIERLKTLAIQEKKSIRLKFLEGGRFQLELLADCQSQVILKVLSAGSWPDGEGAFKLLSESESKKFSLVLASDQVCFDSVLGLEGLKSRKVLVIAPVNDLSENRLDRASYVILDGESAKISIN